ncbi:hypothetical protein BH24ACT15_BH24ACT15_09330 [soil metagenome]
MPTRWTDGPAGTHRVGSPWTSIGALQKEDDIVTARSLTLVVLSSVLALMLAAMPMEGVQATAATFFAEGCYSDGLDDVTMGRDGQSVDIPQSDVTGWCIAYDAEAITVTVSVRQATDPLQDVTWNDYGAAIVMFFEDSQGQPRTLQMAKGGSNDQFDFYVYGSTTGEVVCQGSAGFTGDSYSATAPAGCLDSPGEISVQIAGFHGRDTDGTFTTSPRDYAPDLGFVTVPQGQISGGEDVKRLFGPERVTTAVAVSRQSFGPGQASEVILASSEAFPDAVVAGPLAAAINGPVLLTARAALPQVVLDEIDRAARRGASVRIMGGSLAVSDAVQQSLVAAGHPVTRVAGQNRFETSVAAAQATTADPQNILLAFGGDFGSALVSGAAAPLFAGTVVLIDRGGIPPAVQDYLDAHPGALKYPVGNDAIEAAPPLDGAVGGDSPAAISVEMAKIYPPTDQIVMASAERFPDGLAGGAYAARQRIPLLLSSEGLMETSVIEFLRAQGPWEQITFFGGTSALSSTVAAQAASTLAP